jgi:hypothetical protein
LLTLSGSHRHAPHCSTANRFWRSIKSSPTFTTGCYGLAASFDTTSAPATVNFFFTDDTFSNQKVLMAWSYQFIQPTVNALIASYFPPGATSPSVPDWPSDDYDTVWKVTLDAEGNLTVNNTLCEGIDSAALPATCPKF